MLAEREEARVDREDLERRYEQERKESILWLQERREELKAERP
jgi:hypothetical protein